MSPKEELSDDKIMKEIDSFVNDDNEHLPLEVQLRRLLELQDRVMVLHHPVAKVKRQKMLKIEITKVRRKLSLDKSSQKGWFLNFFLRILRFLCTFFKFSFHLLLSKDETLLHRPCRNKGSSGAYAHPIF